MVHHQLQQAEKPEGYAKIMLLPILVSLRTEASHTHTHTIVMRLDPAETAGGFDRLEWI